MGKKGHPVTGLPQGLTDRVRCKTRGFRTVVQFDGHVDSGLVRLSELAHCCESIKLQP